MKLTYTFFALLFTLSINAQVAWDFATATPTSGVLTNSTVSDVTRGNNNGATVLITNASTSTGYAGATGGNNAGAATFTGALNIATSTYYEVTFTPNASYSISISNIATGSRSTGTGPQLISVRSSLDGYATDLTTATVSNNSTWALPTFSGFSPLTGGVNQPITLRLFGSNGTGSPTTNIANWRIDDLAISYAVAVQPITLKSFSATVNNGNVSLKWLTSNESNIKNYTVEKSENGITFSSITTVVAKNGAENSYQYTDVAISKTTLYYRLKIEDINGKITYSTIARVDNIDATSNLFIFPTVATSIVNAKIKASTNALANIQIIDAVGKIATQKVWNISSGINTIPIDINSLPKGVYRIRIISTNINEVSSFIKD